MNTNELNAYIKNYLENDRTNRAIMLDGPWGSGKSYYIKNVLVPYLCDNGHAAIVVSLYGVSALSDISRSIYMAIRISRFDENKESHMIGKILAKTVLKGVSSYFGVNLSPNEEDLKKLYETIDLEGKLIILEDLERSSIPILDVLGYVNSLVEQDGVKVLLIANEVEIIKNLEGIIDGNETELELLLQKYDQKEKVKFKDKKTFDFLRQKEKTIGDTIKFTGDINKAIKEIMEGFDSDYFKKILNDEETLKYIESTLWHRKNNLRSFVYACQKTNDIFIQYDKKYKETEGELAFPFVKNVFIGNLIYVLEKKGGKQDNQKLVVKDAGSVSSYSYSIFRFAYKYIKEQILDVAEIKEFHNIFMKQKQSEETKEHVEEVLNIISSYSIQEDKKLLDALNELLNLLKSNGIGLRYYRELVAKIIEMKYFIEDDSFINIIEQCKDVIKKNISDFENEEKEYINETMWSFAISSDNKEVLEEYRQYKDEIFSILRNKDTKPIKVDYEDKNQLISALNDMADKAFNKKIFMEKLDCNKLTDIIKKSTSYQILCFRSAFNKVYSISNWKDFLPNDIGRLKTLQSNINNVITNGETYDIIAKGQLKWFNDDLTKYIQAYNSR